MKGILLRVLSVAAVLLALATTAQAQSFAYVDTKYILDKIPEYVAAQKELDAATERWQKEIDDKYAAIEKLYERYRAEEVLLSAEAKKQRQDEIFNLEREAKELQKKRFGYDGDLFKMREERVKPIQDKVFAAVEQVAKERRLSFIFDKAGAMVMLYANPTFDYSDLVLAKLGVQK